MSGKKHLETGKNIWSCIIYDYAKVNGIEGKKNTCVSYMVQIKWCLLNSSILNLKHTVTYFQKGYPICSFMYSTNIYWACIMFWPEVG